MLCNFTMGCFAVTVFIWKWLAYFVLLLSITLKEGRGGEGVAYCTEQCCNGCFGKLLQQRMWAMMMLLAFIASTWSSLVLLGKKNPDISLKKPRTSWKPTKECRYIFNKKQKSLQMPEIATNKWFAKPPIHVHRKVSDWRAEWVRCLRVRVQAVIWGKQSAAASGVRERTAKGAGVNRVQILTQLRGRLACSG